MKRIPARMLAVEMRITHDFSVIRKETRQVLIRREILKPPRSLDSLDVENWALNEKAQRPNIRWEVRHAGL